MEQQTMAEYNKTFDDYCFNGTSQDAVPSEGIQISLVVLYTLTALMSLIGNVIVIIVQYFGSGSSRNIRKYLINLSISDITIGVLCVPFSYTDFVWGRWIFPHWLCPTVQFVQPLSVFITSSTLSIIGVERYMFALHPLSPFHRFLQNHTRPVLAATWILGSVYSYVIFGQSSKIGEIGQENGETYYECIYSSNLSLVERRIFMSVNFVLTFLVPLGIMTFSYVSIMKRLIKCSRQQEETRDFRRNASGWSRSTSFKCRIKTIKIMFTVILLYTACWLPIKLYQFLLEFDILQFCTETEFYLLTHGYIVCHWLAMANSFVNPIIYAIRNHSFRTDFRKISQTIATNISAMRIRSSTEFGNTQV